MKKLLLMFLLITNFTIFSIEDVSIKTFFSNEELSVINNNQLISRMYLKYNAAGENTNEFITIQRTKYNDEDFSKYEIISDEKGFIPYVLTEESKLKFYNTLCSFSKLKGMKYYSRRAGKIEQLIEECYRVTSKSGKKHDDTVYDKIQPKITNMFFQKDNKFGKLFFRSDLYNEGDNFVLINTDLDPVSKLIFTINEKEEYKIFCFFIYDKEKKGFYYYTFQVMRVRVDSVLKMKDLFSPTTFSNRLRASTVHLAKLLGLDWTDRLNPWKGKYDTYK
jgi:hypothetical protein